jgi:hypothetical protein
MTRFGFSALCLCACVASTACIIDKSLGDTDSSGAEGSGDTGTTQPGTSTTMQDTDGASLTATMASDPDSGSSIGTFPPTDGSETDASGTSGPGVCPDWSPPPSDCELSANATADVSGELPETTDEPCRIEAVQNIDASTDAVTFDCAGRRYEITITTDAPHLDLPFSGGEDVLLTATISSEPTISSPASFTVRTVGGGLLLAWINELDFDPDVDIEPVTFNPAPTGCPGFSVDEKCPSDAAIVAQRVMLEFGNGIVPIPVFDGNQAIVSGGAEDMSVIVDRATQITCWDDGCIGDDSGPFDELRLITVVLPSA